MLLRGLLPALLAVSTGVLVAAVRDGSSLTGPLTFVGVVFVLLQVLTPVHRATSAVVGARTADWLNDQLMRGAVTPQGMGHLESTELAEDLSLARDFDLGMNGPPLVVGMDFIASGLVLLRIGLPVRPGPRRLRVVGTAGPAARLGRHPLAAAGERGLAGPQHRGGARRAPARGLCLHPRGRARRRPRSCASSASPTG